jgi:class 3 adenylate cyclase
MNKNFIILAGICIKRVVFFVGIFVAVNFTIQAQNSGEENLSVSDQDEEQNDQLLMDNALQVLTLKIFAGNDSLLIHEEINLGKTDEALASISERQLPFSMNKLKIILSFSGQATDHLGYKYKLEGLDGNWSEWETLSFREYNYLPEGEYSFRLLIKNGEDNESELAYAFTVLPPFSRSFWAYFIYLFIFLACIAAAVKLTANYHNKIKRDLEKVIEEKTKEIQVQKDAIQDKQRILQEKQLNLHVEQLKLHQEKRKSDKLLLNILPKATANDLKRLGTAAPKFYNSVTVMFTDFKNFTQIAETLTPQALIEELNQCFIAFDRIMIKYGIEKIKTIGDSYMCAGGLPLENNSHPYDMILAAMEIQDFMIKKKKEKNDLNIPYWDIRIGVNTGPVIAGVVGESKFAYDIWGDTVNLASRMESSGEPGKINISGPTYELVKEQFICVHRGKIAAKNKGQVDMYFVEGVKDQIKIETAIT